MKTRIITTAMLLACTILLLSAFTMKPGANSYRLYIGDKLILENYVHSSTPTPSMSLDAASGEQLIVLFNECGKTGKSRSLILKNRSGSTLRQWTFNDVGVTVKDPMKVDMKDLAAFHNENSTPGIYYRSENQTETLLASIRWARHSTSNR